MSFVILSHKTHECVKSYLKKSGHTLIEVPSSATVYDAVSNHADIFVCRVRDTLFCAPEISGILSDAGVSHITGGIPGHDYPLNIRYNACTVGDIFIHNLKYTDDALLSFVKESGMKTVNVRQGYTKCSIAPVGSGIITADEGIVRAMTGIGIDILKIHTGHVLLEGFDYGFFGGACGVVGDEFIVNGDLYKHPDGERIADFVRAQGFKVVSFEGIPLCDIGSIIEV